MHDTDTTSPTQTRATISESSASAPHKHARKKVYPAALQQPAVKRTGFMGRVIQCVARLFRRRSSVAATAVSVAELSPEERTAATRAAQLPPAMTFKGDTASTLAAPIGSYAGKPVMQAMRRRAEQQFKTMDTSQMTMN